MKTHERFRYKCVASGKAYLGILGKVLVFLLVFRSKLAYDRFWSGRLAIGNMCGFATTIVTDISTYFDADSDEQVACRAELYRLTLATATVMTVHIRKEASDLIKFHDLT
jgi:predicted membrane chloride channel (bestrophin family)